jgi:hypothetical protein
VFIRISRGVALHKPDRLALAGFLIEIFSATSGDRSRLEASSLAAQKAGCLDEEGIEQGFHDCVIHQA